MSAARDGRSAPESIDNLRKHKNPHWHVDQLTQRRDVRVAAIVLPGVALGECELNRRVERLVHGTVPAAGFGASDCRAGCPAHLWRCETALTAEQLAETLGLQAAHVIESQAGCPAFQPYRGRSRGLWPRLASLAPFVPPDLGRLNVLDAGAHFVDPGMRVDCSTIHPKVP